MINDILDLAMVGSPAFEFNAEVIDLPQVSARCANRPGHGRREKLTLKVQLDMCSAPVCGSARLKPVLYNFVSTPSSSRRLCRITISVTNHDANSFRIASSTPHRHRAQDFYEASPRSAAR